MAWLDDVRSALRQLGGVGHVNEIYSEVARMKGHSLSYDERSGVRRTLYLNSSSSEAWQGRRDLFFSVGRIRGGVWSLRELGEETPKANDINEDQQPIGNANPARVKSEIYRIVRDTAVGKALKKLHRNRCQRCGRTIELTGGATYSEAHHLHPLGRPHGGPDTPENVVVVCPNCHALLDYFAVRLHIGELRTHKSHSISSKCIAYHNKQHRLRRAKMLETSRKGGNKII